MMIGVMKGNKKIRSICGRVPANMAAKTTVEPRSNAIRGLTIFFCYRWTSVIANKENKTN